MRKLILCIIVILSFQAEAQLAFQRKDLFINLGIAGGDYRYMHYPNSDKAGRLLPVFLSVEYGLNDRVSIGPFGGYYFRKYRYRDDVLTDSTDPLVYKSHYTVLGVKGTFHFTEILEKKFDIYLYSEDLDLYVTVLLGYELNSFSRLNGINIGEKSRPVIGAVAGVRYFLNYRIALFGELGPGVFGLGAAGITARF